MLKSISYTTICFATLMLIATIGFSQRAPWPMFKVDALESLHKEIQNEKYGKISSLLLYHDNRLVYERYYGFSQSTTLHQISSVTKSVTSLAVGVCIDRGLIPSLDVPIVSYFPEYNEIFSQDTIKKRITLGHLLTQTSGFKWNEWRIHYSYAGNPLIELSQTQKNWIPIILNLPMDSLPGLKFSYNSGGSEIIKEIISRASGITFKQFVEENILKKLNINSYSWDTYPKNGEPAWGGISLATSDMAKIGLLLQANGMWGDQRIISEDWVNKTSQIAVLTDTDSLWYGLHWWISKQPDGSTLVFAAGYGDQYVFIVPDKNIVVAINGKNFTDHKWDKDYKNLIGAILNAYTLPSEPTN